MTEAVFLQAMGLIVVAAAAVMLIGRTARIPSIVSYMLAGLLIGPVFGLLPSAEAGTTAPEELSTISEIGIVLLLFLVGLEMSLKEIREVGPVAIVAAAGQMIVMGGSVFGISTALGFAPVEAVILAIAFGFSSTVVVVKLLDQRGHIESTYGRVAVGTLLVQDIAVIIVLTVLAGLGKLQDAGASEPGASSADAPPMDLGAMAGGLGSAFLFMIILLGLTLLASRYVLPKLFSLVAKSPRGAMIWSLAWCFVLVELAHVMGLSVEIGSFLAGVSLGQLPRRNDLRRRVRPLMNFFIAVFFVTLGSEIELAKVQELWLASLLLIVLVIVVKPPVFFVLIARCGYSKRSAFDAAISLGQISEFSLILGAVALDVGLFGESDDVVSLLSVVGLGTIIVSVVIMGLREPIYRRLDSTGVLDRLAPSGRKGADTAHHDRPSGHIVIVGMNTMGRSIARALAEKGERVVAIDTDPHKLAGLPVEKRLGDISYMDTLTDAGLGRAKLAISALKIDEANRLFVHRCQSLGVPVVVHGFDRSVLEGLERLGPAFLINSKAAADERLEEFVFVREEVG